MNRLINQQTARLDEFYHYQDQVKKSYEKLYGTLGEIQNNYRNPAILEEHYAKVGSVVWNAFDVDLKRNNLLMYIEIIFDNVSREPIPGQFKELREAFRKSEEDKTKKKKDSTVQQ